MYAYYKQLNMYAILWCSCLLSWLCSWSPQTIHMRNMNIYDNTAAYRIYGGKIFGAQTQKCLRLILSVAKY